MLQLLGKDCYDIDIALDDMLGREFCEKVNEYLSSAGEETHGIGVIQWYFSLLHLAELFPQSFTFESIRGCLH